MATVTVTQCDQCRAEIPQGRRHFSLDIALYVVNGQRHQQSGVFPDLCSEQCLHEALTAMTRAVEAMPVEEG